MIIQRLCTFSVRFTSIHPSITRTSLFLQLRNRSSSHRSEYSEHLESMIGNREMVGFGMNGQPMYTDHPAFPFPAIRYKQQTPEIMALRQKEKGDWRLLSIQEKKELYRASFCQTFSEFKYVSSEWMYITGCILISISIGIWLYIWMLVYVYGRYPKSFSYLSKQEQLKRQIDLRMNPIFGLASKWDYEKNDWKEKEKGWFTPENPFLDDECEDEEDENDPHVHHARGDKSLFEDQSNDEGHHR